MKRLTSTSQSKESLRISVSLLLSLLIIACTAKGIPVSASEFITTRLPRDQQIRKTVVDLAGNPFSPDAPKLVAEILDDAYIILNASSEYIEPWLDTSLDIVSEVLRVNPVRPGWHVTAVRASAGIFRSPLSTEWMVYVKHLAQITDVVGPREFYEIHEFAHGVDPRILWASKKWLVEWCT